MSYIGNRPDATATVGNVNFTEYLFTASGGETSFSGADDNGNTLNYAEGKIHVLLNGVHLENDTDYTATNGTSISGLAALSASDVLTVVAYSSFEVSELTGTTNEIDIASSVIGLADNTVIPGVGSIQIPASTTANQSTSTNGRLRYDTDLNKLRAVINGTWYAVTTDEDGVIEKAGKQTIWIPASGMTPTTTNGAEADTTELATNDIMLETLLFDQTTNEYAQVSFFMPKSYNGGTILATFLWTVASGSGDVIWGIQGASFGNDDALDSALGTAQTVTDTVIAANDLHITAETSAITITNAAAEELTILKIYRDAASGSDTLAADAKLIGVKLIYTTDLANDD